MKEYYHENIEMELERLRPLGDFVLVKRIIEERDTPQSLIVLPDQAKAPRLGLRRGLVVRVGLGDMTPDGGRLPINVKPGDEVIYWRVPANDLRINGEEHTMLHEEQHVVAVVER